MRRPPGFALPAAFAAVIASLALGSCALREDYGAETVLAVSNSELRDFLLRGEIPMGRVDRRDRHLALLDERRGAVRMGSPGAWREAVDNALQDGVRIALRRDDAVVALWKPESMQLDFLRFEALPGKSRALARESLASIALPRPAPVDTNDHWAPPEDPIRDVRLSDRGTLLYHIDTGRLQGVLKLDKAGTAAFHAFPERLMTNQGLFIFHGFRIGWREELAYGVYVQTSRRGIEKTLLMRLDLPSGAIRSKTVFVCDPAFFFDVVDDAEAVFSQYDENEKTWRFEYRNLDNGKVRLSKAFRARETLPPDLRFDRKTITGTVYEENLVRFVSWR